MDLHPDIAPLAFLVGTWEGDGVGVYPTIAGFSYHEAISFVAPPGKPFLHYTQRTFRTGDHPESGTPLHTEAGYVRPVGDTGVEATIAQPSGIVEVHSGIIDGTSLVLVSDTVAVTRTAKDVRSVERRINVAGDELSYELWMGAVEQPHQLHLKAVLERVT